MLEDAECPTLESLKSSYILYLFPGKKKKYIYIHILLTIKGIYKGKLHKATELLPPIVKDFISKT